MKRKYPQYDCQGQRHLSGDYRFKASYSDRLKPKKNYAPHIRRLKIAGLVLGAVLIVLIGCFLYFVIADLAKSADGQAAAIMLHNMYM